MSSTRPVREKRAPVKLLEMANEDALAQYDTGILNASENIAEPVNIVNHWDATAKCAICLGDILVRGVPYECRAHYFCYDHIRLWVKGSTPRCPLCNVMITRIAKCRTKQEMDSIKWEKVPVVKFSAAVSKTLKDSELIRFAELRYIEADHSFESGSTDESDSVSSEAVDENEISSVSEEETDDARSSVIDDIEEDEDGPWLHSYYGDSLSREPTFTGRRRAPPSESSETSSSEEVEFSSAPGEEGKLVVKRKLRSSSAAASGSAVPRKRTRSSK